MSPALCNTRLWKRIAVVASLAWLAMVGLTYIINDSFGDRLYLRGVNYVVAAVCGTALIWALGLGIPWVAQAAKEK